MEGVWYKLPDFSNQIERPNGHYSPFRLLAQVRCDESFLDILDIVRVKVFIRLDDALVFDIIG
jgi:hypothetical protein